MLTGYLFISGLISNYTTYRSSVCVPLSNLNFIILLLGVKSVIVYIKVEWDRRSPILPIEESSPGVSPDSDLLRKGLDLIELHLRSFDTGWSLAF